MTRPSLQQNIDAKFIACELSITRVVTFGVVMYRNQLHVNFIIHYAELHIGISIKYNNTLHGNCFHKSNIVRKISIPFNCFSEYNIFILHQGFNFYVVH